MPWFCYYFRAYTLWVFSLFRYPDVRPPVRSIIPCARCLILLRFRPVRNGSDRIGSPLARSSKTIDAARQPSLLRLTLRCRRSSTSTHTSEPYLQPHIRVEATASSQDLLLSLSSSASLFRFLLYTLTHAREGGRSLVFVGFNGDARAVVCVAWRTEGKNNKNEECLSRIRSGYWVSRVGPIIK